MRRRRRRSQEGVELNLAAMLDMAFQLLTFFILTFKPSPVEGEVGLRLPPPQPITQTKGAQVAAGDEIANLNVAPGVESLVITVMAGPSGKIGSLVIGDRKVPHLGELEAILKFVLADRAAGFDQVVIRVAPDLRYEELMRVIDVCARQRLAGGERLTKLTFVELPKDGAAAP